VRDLRKLGKLVGVALLACCTSPRVHEETRGEFICRVAPGASVEVEAGVMKVAFLTESQAKAINARYPNVFCIFVTPDASASTCGAASATPVLLPPRER